MLPDTMLVASHAPPIVARQATDAGRAADSETDAGGAADSRGALYAPRFAHASKGDADPASDAGVDLGHPRLSILKPPPAPDQAMGAGDRSFWIFYSGVRY